MLGNSPLGGAALGDQGGGASTLVTSAGAFTLVGQAAKPDRLIATQATYTFSWNTSASYKQVTTSNGYTKTFDTGLRCVVLPATAGAYTLTGYPPSIVYTQYIPQTVFPFWIFAAGQWAWAWLILYIELGWFNGQSVRSIHYNVGPASFTISGQAWLTKGIAASEKVTSVAAEVVYTQNAPTEKVTSVAAEVVYAPVVTQKLTSAAFEVVYSLIKGIQPTPATYTLAGVSQNLARSRIMNTTAGAYALAGVSQSFHKTLSLGAAAGSYSLSGVTQTFHYIRAASAAAGAYTLVGVNVTLNYIQGKRLDVAAGSFSLSGVTQTFHYTRAAVATAGSYSLAPQTANLKLPMRVAAGSYSLAPQTANLHLQLRVVNANAAPFIWTGVAATLLHNWLITPVTGSYMTAAGTANLHLPLRVANTAYGTITLAASSANLHIQKHQLNTIRGDAIQWLLGPQTALLLRIVTPLRTLSTAAGVLTLHGRNATLAKGLAVSAGASAYTVLGYDGNLRVIHSKMLAPDAGAFTMVAPGTAMLFLHMLTASAATYALAGTASLRWGKVLRPNVAGYDVSGNQAGLAKSIALRAAAGALNLTPYTATLKQVHLLSAAQSTFLWTANTAVLARFFNSNQSASGAYTAHGNAATLSYARVVAPAAGSITLVGNGSALHKTQGMSCVSGTIQIAGQGAVLLGNRKLNANASVVALSPGTAALVNSQTLVASAGALSLSGSDANLRHQIVPILVGPGFFAIAGNPVQMTSAMRTLVTGAGALVVSANSQNLNVSRGIVASVNTFQIAGRRVMESLRAGATGIVIVGSGATLSPTRNIKSTTGSFGVAPNSAQLLVTTKITASATIVALAPTAPTLTFERVLSASAGALALAGQGATLRRLRSGLVAAAQFQLSASTAVVKVPIRLLSTQVGGITLVGTPIDDHAKAARAHFSWNYAAATDMVDFRWEPQTAADFVWTEQTTVTASWSKQ